MSRKHRMSVTKQTKQFAWKDDADVPPTPTATDPNADWKPREWTKKDFTVPMEAGFQDFLHIHRIEPSEDNEFLRYVFMEGVLSALSTLKFGIRNYLGKKVTVNGYSIEALIAEACVATNNLPDPEDMVHDSEDCICPLCRDDNNGKFSTDGLIPTGNASQH